MGTKLKLTDSVVARASLPEGKSDLVIWDSEVAGFGLRLRPGGKTWILAYRPAGSGRSANLKRMKLATVDAAPDTVAARNLARIARGRIASGTDPLAERKTQRHRKRLRVEDLIDRYDRALKKRGYVNRSVVVSGLKLRLKTYLAADIADLSGPDLIGIIDGLEKTGRHGAAEDFRSRCRAFLNWCVVRAKVIDRNPLAGFRRERATRVDRIAATERGKALSDRELASVWLAADPLTAFGRLVRFYVLTGSRRGEGAGLTRAMVDDGSRTIELPAMFVKQGRGHSIPVTDALAALLAECVEDARSDLIFPSPQTGEAFRGWTQMVAKLRKASGVAFSLHDLRRTFRTGLSRLGVGDDVAERAIGHAREELIGIYNRDEAAANVRAAAEAWASHVQTVVEAEVERRKGAFA